MRENRSHADLLPHLLALYDDDKILFLSELRLLDTRHLDRLIEDLQKIDQIIEFVSEASPEADEEIHGHFGRNRFGNSRQGTDLQDGRENTMLGISILKIRLAALLAETAVKKSAEEITKNKTRSTFLHFARALGITKLASLRL